MDYSNISANTTEPLNCPLPEVCDDQGGDNVGLAFGLTIAAGLATLLGSFLPFIPCVKRSSKQWLACSLALAAGVMLYVSFTEILAKSSQYFCCEIPEHYDIVAAASFFGGIILTVLLDLLTKFLVKLDCGFLCCHNACYSKTTSAKNIVAEANYCPSCVMTETASNSSATGKEKNNSKSCEMISITNSMCEEMTNENIVTTSEEVKNDKPRLIRRPSYSEMLDMMEKGSMKEKNITEQQYDSRSLQKMGLLTCLAIGIHNFPEGIATFVATLSSPALGAALALAIALHNIPEGICVAMPVYFATGSKLKALFWSFLSGISEPIGALLGWLIFREVFGSIVYGVLFGLVAGMMVYISLLELLPTAFRYSQNSKMYYLVPTSLIIGMAIMAASLLLFIY